MSSKTVTEEIGSFLPPLTAPNSDYPLAFQKIANFLLNSVNLMIQGQAHRLTEIEFYFNGGNHPDKFTHGDKMQNKFGVWYFHKYKGEYRSGTFKGLDIAFGNDKVAAGILIRGIECLSDKSLIDGPSLSVDRMLKLTESESIANLVSKFDLSVEPPSNGDSPLYLVTTETRNNLVVECPRVGLSLKYGNNESKWRYIARNYRFLSEPTKIKKGKIQMVIGLYQTGKNINEISRLTGAKEASIKNYISSYEEGKDKSPDSFSLDPSSEDLCGLFGACQKYINRD